MRVADWSNNRVLEFTHPFSTREAASVVLGQRASISAPVHATCATAWPTKNSSDRIQQSPPATSSLVCPATRNTKRAGRKNQMPRIVG
ncbi:MAG TPA: hypothetical protein VLU99_04170 [Nitrososphaerales archaeon]|nr:hypothetical protein [Nitrososphaerales archaeon]